MFEVSDPPEFGDVIAYAECMTEGSGTDPTQQPNFSQLHNVVSSPGADPGGGPGGPGPPFQKV